MKRQTVLALLRFVSQSLKNIEILHSQVSYQLQELESRENLQNERTLQEIKSQLIKRSKLLTNCARHQKRILFQVEETKLFWVFKKKKIISLLKEYSWESLDRMTKVFEDWTDGLLNLEKQLVEVHYYSLDLADLERTIEENILEQFTKINWDNSGNCDNMKGVIQAYQIMAEYSRAERKQSANCDCLGYHNKLQKLNNKVLEIGEVSM